MITYPIKARILFYDECEEAWLPSIIKDIIYDWNDSSVATNHYAILLPSEGEPFYKIKYSPEVHNLVTYIDIAGVYASVEQCYMEQLIVPDTPMARLLYLS